jgi:type II secretory pathway component GspD/PulD (secretin)
MVMKRRKYLILGLFPLAISAALLQGTNNNPPKARAPESLKNATGVPSNDGQNDDQNDDSEKVEVIYSGADPRDIVAALEQLTGRTALIGPKLSTNKISISSKEPISRLEAIEALESVLSLNDVAIVGGEDEKFFKVVSSRSALTQSPSIIDESLLEFSPSQKISSKFFKLHYLDAGEFQK